MSLCLSNECGRSGTLLFCGSMYLNFEGLHTLLGMIYRVMCTTELVAFDPGITHLLENKAREVKLGRVGSAGIAARLADLLATIIIRSWVERDCGDSSGWIVAISDRQIGKMLAAIHLDRNQNWTEERWPR